MRYRDEIVQPYVIPFIQAQANNVTFQQDNARPHVARVVRHNTATTKRLTLNDTGVCISFSYTAVNTRTAITAV
jgi:hypothetical protein